MESAIDAIFEVLSFGAIIVLVVLGLGIIASMMGIFNFAHGEFVLLGAYTTYAVQTAMPGHIGISILAAIPAAFVVSGLTGVAMERTIIRFLYGRPLETLLATITLACGDCVCS